MSEPGTSMRPGADLMRQFVPSSAYVRHLGIKLVDIQPGRATLAMPYRPEPATMGDVVHGGALASLLDTAAMAAAWSDAEVPANLRGTTVGLSLNYLAPANGEEVTAAAVVLRRGRNLVYLEVDVRTASGTLVVKGLVTYKIG